MLLLEMPYKITTKKYEIMTRFHKQKYTINGKCLVNLESFSIDLLMIVVMVQHCMQDVGIINLARE